MQGVLSGGLLAGLDPAAASLVAISLVAASGLMLGQLRAGGVALGVGGVLFAGLFWGHLGLAVDPAAGRFLREFGLILFVYAIGIQVGPGFFSALRLTGLRLNLLAAGVVGLSLLLTLGLALLFDLPVPVAAGLMAGAVTNTPALGATTQMLEALGAGPEVLAMPAQAYAVAYPFGIVGILLTMILLRRLFRVDLEAERGRFDAARNEKLEALDSASVVITNPNVDGLALSDLPGLEPLRVVVSRLMREGTQRLAGPGETVRLGDVLLLVGQPRALRDMTRILGQSAADDLKAMPSSIRWERVAVTREAVLGLPLASLSPLSRHDVVISRVNRAGVELSPTPALRLQFGDICTVIGEPGAIAAAVQELGNSKRMLNQAQVMPIFVGIALGVLAGSVPLSVPGMPAALKLGLAGGPLVVAILLSRLGHFGPMVWFMPPSAGQVLRDIGIVLFLGVVGLTAGAGFVAHLVDGEGLRWLGFGAALTLVPLLVVGIIASVQRLNHLTVCGLLAGSMTDPPALAFAESLADSEAPSLAYATVYPLVMVLRILAAQLLVLMLWGP